MDLKLFKEYVECSSECSIKACFSMYWDTRQIVQIFSLIIHNLKTKIYKKYIYIFNYFFYLFCYINSSRMDMYLWIILYKLIVNFFFIYIIYYVYRYTYMYMPIYNPVFPIFFFFPISLHLFPSLLSSC